MRRSSSASSHKRERSDSSRIQVNHIPAPALLAKILEYDVRSGLPCPVGQNDHFDWCPLSDMGANGAAAAENFIVGMWC